ncbi:DsbE family thiol:disulfide interchange protein [Rhizobium sp. L1K21]|uniref:DsbE family thiol:disulfide interchange protein n=1 Tax=Rhizobium sp. L1K21 TaxID=2954933 RepID=UPI0020931620|nr:DsbE family thiol:disulfide interchange protein [Rhizobium sp. L1K21]MCO6188078.1 DsbE family thiol:disulfide interchange protein [Rhizobium sp. L1K21]
MTDEPVQPEKKGGLSKTGIVIAFLPFLIFILLSGVFWMQLESGKDPSVLPSALLNKPAPSLNMQPLEGANTPALTYEAVKGKLTLVNVWASWCIPCRDEAPELMELAKDPRIQIVGINYKDKNANALSFLEEFGNPFAAIGVDPNGKAAIDWGVYGVPETYLVDETGKIIYKKVGPFDPDSIQNELMPHIEKASGQAGR